MFLFNELSGHKRSSKINFERDPITGCHRNFQPEVENCWLRQTNNFNGFKIRISNRKIIFCLDLESDNFLLSDPDDNLPNSVSGEQTTVLIIGIFEVFDGIEQADNFSLT